MKYRDRSYIEIAYISHRDHLYRPVADPIESNHKKQRESHGTSYQYKPVADSIKSNHGTSTPKRSQIGSEMILT